MCLCISVWPPPSRPTTWLCWATSLQVSPSSASSSTSLGELTGYCVCGKYISRALQVVGLCTLLCNDGAHTPFLLSGIQMSVCLLHCNIHTPITFVPACSVHMLRISSLRSRKIRMLGNHSALKGITFLSLFIYKYVADTSFIFISCLETDRGLVRG